MANENEKESTKNILSRFNISSGNLRYGLIIIGVIAILAAAYYFYAVSQRVYSDKAEISTPLIILGPKQPGVLQKILVKNGDHVALNQPVARMDDGELIKTEISGTIVDINDQIGKLFTPGTAVVTMINPDDLRLLVHVAENEGLSDIHTGQKVEFTVDAFGSSKFYGEVEEMPQTSDSSSVVFSISDKREEKYFSVKIKYSGYPELLNGMSAKAWIYK